MAIRRIENMEINSMEQINLQTLRRASRATARPFQMSLVDSKDLLFCDEIVRIIPGKRLVAFGSWGNKSVVAKLFYEPRHAVRHADRDAKGIKALLAAGVLTPTLFFQGRAHEKRIQVLIFERVPGESLDQIWEQKNEIHDVFPLLRNVTLELAAHHVMGIAQRDLHFKNFIINGKHIYTIDGGDVELFDTPLSKKESLDNLALFFSQLGIGTEKLQQSLFQIYAQSRSWIVKNADVKYLDAALNRWMNKRLEQYDKKIMRNCSDFVRRDSLTTISVYDRSYETRPLLTALKNPEAFINASNAQRLKGGRSSTVVKIQIEGKPYVIKRYNMKGLGHWLRRSLRETRASRGWRLAQRLRLLGIATARPVAFVENHFLGFRGTSYLLMEYVEGEHVGEFFATSVRDTAMATHTADKIVSIFENLARLRITHGDLKMTNILFANQGPVLIDLDGMAEHGSQFFFKRRFHKEIKRFMQNWREKPTLYVMFEQLVQEMYLRLGMKW